MTPYDYVTTISIVNNSSGIQKELGTTVKWINKWINNDSLPHTVPSGKPDNREVPTEELFAQACILSPGQSSENIVINAEA